MRIVAASVAALVLLGACGSDGYGGDDANGRSGDADSSDGPARDAPVMEMSIGSIDLAVTVDPDPPVAGGDVTWIATITNRSGRDTETLTFTSGLQVDVALQQDGEEVYRWSEGRAFTQALVEEELEPGESVEVRLDGILDVEPGGYDLLVEPGFQRARESELVGGGFIEVVEAGD